MNTDQFFGEKQVTKITNAVKVAFNNLAYGEKVNILNCEANKNGKYFSITAKVTNLDDSLVITMDVLKETNDDSTTVRCSAILNNSEVQGLAFEMSFLFSKLEYKGQLAHEVSNALILKAEGIGANIAEHEEKTGVDMEICKLTEFLVKNNHMSIQV